jgi:arylsulfatase A-like enzyme
VGPYRRRLLLIFAPIAALLVFLLWPLSNRRWDIAWDPAAEQRRTEVLAGQRPVRRGAPRVIVILADDLGTTDISLYGGTNVETPNIDRIGREGVTFTDASCTTAVCAPSRASLLTGRYQQKFGFEMQPHDRYAINRLEYIAFRHFINTRPMVPIAPAPVPRRAAREDQGIPPSELLLSELLGARGYRTAIFGKWHLGYSGQFSPLERGFERHYGFYEAFSLYADPDDDEVVHTPIDDFSDRHMWRTARTGASTIVENDQAVEESGYLTFKFADLAAGYIRENASEPFFLYLPFSAPHTPLQAPVEHYAELEHIADPVRRTYYAMIAALDDAVGTVLDAVEESGIADNTIVVFSSDNGGTTYLGVTDNGPYAGGKFSTFQGGLSVPLMIRYPDGIPAGTAYDGMVSLLDVVPTIDAITRDATGTRDAPAIAFDGVNLLPYIRGETDDPAHEWLFWRSWYNRAVRRGPWKLLVQARGSPGLPATDQVRLYDLISDPYERHDLADQFPDVVAELRRGLKTWEEGLIAPLWPPVMHIRIRVLDNDYWFAI